MKRTPVNDKMCATCPWREGSPYAHLANHLEERALGHESRICHSTGSNAINARTGKAERLCRGARNVQLRFLKGIGFLADETDEAWTAKCQELNIEQDSRKKRA